MNEIARPEYAVVPGMDHVRQEPEVGTVLVYRVEHGNKGNPFDQTSTAGGAVRVYHYASIRAGDGRWYTTGRKAEQGVDWLTLSGALRDSQAQVWSATGWVVFEL